MPSPFRIDKAAIVFWFIACYNIDVMIDETRFLTYRTEADQVESLLGYIERFDLFDKPIINYFKAFKVN